MTGGAAASDGGAEGSGPEPSSGGPGCRIDAHAHFHACFSAPGFLDAAAANFRAWGGPAGARPGAAGRGCLLFADPGERRSLEALASGTGPGGWEVRETGEAASRMARGAGGEELALVAGRQVATEEGLEVLALATASDVPAGAPLRETVEAALSAGAVAVLPWGFGKWWLGRGRLARRLVASVRHPLFFLGDNGGRPRGWPEPELFRIARDRGTRVLPGSDPLPFPSEQDRAGSYGFRLPGVAPGDRPAARVREGLRGLDRDPAPRGTRTGLLRFALSQVRMQVRKRGRP